MWYRLTVLMGKCEKLLHAARTAPRNLRFEELCQLAICYGFSQRGGRGSHRVYTNGVSTLSFQEGKNGEAKVYQVKLLLKVIDETKE